MKQKRQTMNKQDFANNILDIISSYEHHILPIEIVEILIGLGTDLSVSLCSNKLGGIRGILFFMEQAIKEYQTREEKIGE